MQNAGRSSARPEQQQSKKLSKVSSRATLNNPVLYDDQSEGS
jgi:hypothetical protein